jgi:hypothetical protein
MVNSQRLSVTQSRTGPVKNVPLIAGAIKRQIEGV